MRLFPCEQCIPHCGEWFIDCCIKGVTVHYMEKCHTCGEKVPEELKRKRIFLMNLIDPDLVK